MQFLKTRCINMTGHILSSLTKEMFASCLTKQTFVFLYIPYWMGVEERGGLVSVFAFGSMFQTFLYLPVNQKKMNKNLYCNKNPLRCNFKHRHT